MHDVGDIPDGELTFDNARTVLESLKKIPDQQAIGLDPNSKEFTLSLSIRQFSQAILSRVRELGEAALDLQADNKVVSAGILTRALFETVALFYHISETLKEPIRTGKPHQACKYIWKALLGEYRGGEKGFDAIKLRTFAVKLNDLSPSLRTSYAALCELAHPNYLGCVGAYTKLNREKFCFEVTENFDHIANVIEHPLSFALSFFEIHYAEISKVIVEFMEIKGVTDELVRIFAEKR